MPVTLNLTERRLRILNAIHNNEVVKLVGRIRWGARNITDEFTPLQAAGYAGIGSTYGHNTRTPRPVKLTDKGRHAIGVEVDDDAE